MWKSTLIPILLFAVGCTTWAPAKTVTLHDVDRELATVEGSDLRYRTADPVTCDGPRGCRDVVTRSEALLTYRWESLCDGRFCDSVELDIVNLTREAATIAFTAEQVSAACQLLAQPQTTGIDRSRLETFVHSRLADLDARIRATDAALRALPLEDTFGGRDAGRYVKRATSYLARARPAGREFRHGVRRTLRWVFRSARTRDTRQTPRGAYPRSRRA